LNARPEADGTFANLPTHELEDALHGVLIEPQQIRDGSFRSALG
jgi:hypothetical protein